MLGEQSEHVNLGCSCEKTAANQDSMAKWSNLMAVIKGAAMEWYFQKLKLALVQSQWLWVRF